MTEPSKRKAKGFFALDVRQFERIRSSGLEVEEAAAYLCLSVSTDQSNITSSGGINSIMEYSGLSRAEAKKAVQQLEHWSLLKRLEVERKRARTVPRYALPIHDNRQALGKMEGLVVGAIAAGEQPRARDELNAAQRAQRKGYIEKRSDGWHLIEHTNEVAFIPNSFVRATQGESPLRRLVTYGELGPIMLAAELYQLQDLMNERGVPPSIVRKYYSSCWNKRIGQHQMHRLELGRTYKDAETGHQNTIEAACKPNRLRAYKQDSFWPDLEALEAMHIVEWAVYNANGKPSGDEHAFNRPQRPLGVLRNGRQVLDTPESLPAFAAYLIKLHYENSGRVTKSLAQLIAQWQESSPIVALENQSVTHVEGVGILRMTHRAATQNTSVWFRDLRKECSEAIFFAEQVARANLPQLAALIEEIRSKGDAAEAISM